MRNFRVMLRDGQYAIHEVFYGDDARMTGYSQDPVSPRGESIDELAAEVRRYAQALDEEPLDCNKLESDAERKRQTTG